jgi:hypothetical protein
MNSPSVIPEAPGAALLGGGFIGPVHVNVRYYPICREIRERVLRGDLGRLLSVTGSYVQDWLLDPNDFNFRGK